MRFTLLFLSSPLLFQRNVFRAPTENTCSDFGPFLQQPKEETKTIHDDENEEVEEKKKVDGVFFAGIIPIFWRGSSLMPIYGNFEGYLTYLLSFVCLRYLFAFYHGKSPFTEPPFGEYFVIFSIIAKPSKWDPFFPRASNRVGG